MSTRCRWIVWTLWLAAPLQASEEPRPRVGRDDRALILVGLPGDDEHAASFRSTAQVWRTWLTGPLGFPASGVQVVSIEGREAIRREVEPLSGVEGRVWIFVLGHTNLKDGHAFFHLPGPDYRDDELARLFQRLKAREQVVWLTTPASGRFLTAFSAPGRIVIAATEAEGETNETEFPLALADVCRREPALLDLDHDGQVSVQEVFLATLTAVKARYTADRRAPTEHPRLDDDGDGVGSEFDPPTVPGSGDGQLASKTILPMIPLPTSAKPSTRSDHGPQPAAPAPR